MIPIQETSLAGREYCWSGPNNNWWLRSLLNIMDFLYSIPFLRPLTKSDIKNRECLIWREQRPLLLFFASKLNSRSSDFFSQKRREGQFVSQRQRPLWLLLYLYSRLSIETGGGLHLIDIKWELKIEISRGRHWSSSIDIGSELSI